VIAGPILPGVAEVLEAGRREGVAPALSAAVRCGGELVHRACHGELPAPQPRELRPGDLFDVASLTKVLATATLAAQAVHEGTLRLDEPLCRWLPGFAAAGKGGVTPRHLLAHSSGLPWWRPYHEGLSAEPDPARRRAAVVEALFAEPLEAPPATRTTYSDPGFMALGLGLEAALGARLPALFEARVAAPLGLRDTFFVDALDPVASAARSSGRAFAPTRREGVRGLRQGTVDDDNAWALGGAAGHAGLFSTALDVAAIGQAWLDALDGRPSPVPAEAARRFATRDAAPPSSRALGWDTRSPEGSTLGSWLGRGPRGALGHLAFTGCSLWLDLDARLVAVLLTNHVHPAGSDRARIHGLRQRFHDAVAEGLGLAGPRRAGPAEEVA
jgi:CubicO group peptidase (beta-lactamase class C family)